MKILGIDTSGKIASVAVCDGGRLLGEVSYEASQTHSQVILPLTKKLLEKVEIEIDDIDCIAVSEGPGSYTGLRIGISAVKGICFDEKTKCMGISTLRSLAQNVSCFNGVIVSVMKARNRLDYFCAYACHNGNIKPMCDEGVKSYEEISEIIEEKCKKASCFEEVWYYSEASADDTSILLVGDDAENIKKEMFEFDDRVLVAPMSLRCQRASSLCEIAQTDSSKWVSCEKLEARYLQVTKAEKDLREGVK